MFSVGDIVIYGTQGICKVDAIGPLPMSFADKSRQYYTLRPYYSPEMVIYAPVDNQKIVIREPLSRAEAEKLIEEIPEIETVWIPNEKERETQYRDALHTCSCRELVRIIKTLRRRKEARARKGKRGTAIDERYFRMAEEQLYGELAFVLGMDKADMPEYIASKIENKQEQTCSDTEGENAHGDEGNSNHRV